VEVSVSGVSGEGAGRGTAVRLVYNKTEIDEAAAALRAAKATLRRAQRREDEADAGGGGGRDDDAGEEGEEEGDSEEEEDDTNAAGDSKRKRKKSSAFSEESAASAALLQSIRARVYAILAISGDGARDGDEGADTAAAAAAGGDGDDGKSAAGYLRAAMVRHGYLDAAAAEAVSNVDSITLVAQLRESERRHGRITCLLQSSTCLRLISAVYSLFTSTEVKRNKRGHVLSPSSTEGRRRRGRG
jgi:hypothetical protein